MSYLLCALGVVIVCSPASAMAQRQGDEVVLSIAEPAIVTAESVDMALYGALNFVDPQTPADSRGFAIQALAVLGREDLIADDQNYSASQQCASSAGVVSFQTIIKAAAETSIVIVSENHLRSDHRLFVRDLLVALAPHGYDVYAAETLLGSGFVDIFSEGNLRDAVGYYSHEAKFSNLLRTAHQLGFSIAAYEQRDDQRIESDDLYTRTEAREEAQAGNLVSLLVGLDQGRKIVIHVGGGHGREVPTPWTFSSVPLDRKPEMRWMASRLKEKTGVDPLTISQTSCHAAGSELVMQLAPPGNAFDLLVGHPESNFVMGRPRLKPSSNFLPIPIPATLLPSDGWHVIEARPLSAPSNTAPADRVAVRADEAVGVTLHLLPGAYQVRAVRP